MRKFEMPRIITVIVLCVSLALPGCGLNTAESGFGGAAVGAGTGALIGSLIKNGDVGQSAGLGAIIGFPAGIILTLAANSMFSSSTSQNDRQVVAEIEENQREIIRNNAEIESLRNSVNEEIPTRNPPSTQRKHIYDGPTFGNLYR